MSGMADDIKFVLWLLLLSGSSLCFGSDLDIECLKNDSSLCFGSDLDIKCLKNVQQSVVDPNGILESSWNFDSSTNGFICRFHGVECWHPNENRVLALYLSNLGLEGQFPQGLENCISMVALDLSSNNFSGPIPSDISLQVPFLTSLDLSYNSFSGEIPVLIYNVSFLNTLNLQHNQLIGPIPSEIALLDRLMSFNVADNQLSGAIPLQLQRFRASSFAGNQGLCGALLGDDCGAPLYRISDHPSIGTAAGFAVGFVVAFYSHTCWSSRRGSIPTSSAYRRRQNDHFDCSTSSLAFPSNLVFT